MFFTKTICHDLSGTRILELRSFSVGSIPCQCQDCRCLEGKGHNVFDDRESILGRHLLKLFFQFSWNLLACAMGHKSGMQMPPSFNSHFPLLMTNSLILRLGSLDANSALPASILWDGSLSICI